MEINVLKLGTKCTDKATELIGSLTHWVMYMDGRVEYVFQPEGLDDEGQPVRKLFLCESRLTFQENDYETVEVPFEILGTKVVDKASGFTGTAIAFIRHLNGCFHVDVQPPGILPGKGTPIRKNDFDLRSLEGEKIIELSKKEHEESLIETPSPISLPDQERGYAK